MPSVRRRAALIIGALLISAGCSEPGRRLDESLRVVEVIETPPPIYVEPEPTPAPQLAPIGALTVLVPEPVYVTPLPPPVKHVVTVSALPAGATALDQVQSLELDVEVSGGALGLREISVVFVSPQGVAWERKAERIDAREGAVDHVHFSLPVASTFIEDQRLSGDWQLTTLDEGVEQATARFTLGGMTP